MTDAIRKLIQSTRRPRGWDDELPSKIGDRAEAELAALEVKSSSDDTEIAALTSWSKSLKTEREALREACRKVIELVDGKDFDTDLQLSEIRDEAQTALASAPSDKVLVSKDKLREINTALAALALSQEGERRERAVALMNYTAVLIGEEG